MRGPCASSRVTVVVLVEKNQIAEVWIVDLVHEQVTVYSDPDNGRYQRVQTSSRGGIVTSSALPTLRLAVDAILA